jgi:hypothetical protein
MHQFIVNTFFFNVALILDLPLDNKKSPEECARISFEKMYNDYDKNELDPSKFDKKILQLFRFYCKNRHYLCLTP